MIVILMKQILWTKKNCDEGDNYDNYKDDDDNSHINVSDNDDYDSSMYDDK